MERKKDNLLVQRTGLGDVHEKFGQPKLRAIMLALRVEFKDYKYTVYRCASKVLRLRKLFYTTDIPYKVLVAVLEKHGLGKADPNQMLPPFQLTSVLQDAYNACESMGHFSNYVSYEPEQAVIILANFLWNIFDPKRRHSVSLLEFKMAMLLLSEVHGEDEICSEFYSMTRDAKSKCVTKLNFESLLHALIKLCTYLDEGNGYGAHNTELIMKQCFPKTKEAGGLSERQFCSMWRDKSSRFRIYVNLVTLVQRLTEFEEIEHKNTCASCGMCRIIGIRFKCQVCSNLNLCLRCFATGYAANKHESGHRMYEMFTEDAPPRKWHHYFAKLCTKYSFGKHQSEDDAKSLCNIDDAASKNEDNTLEPIKCERAVVHAASINSNGTFVKIAERPKIYCSARRRSQRKTPVENASLLGLVATATNASNASERLQSIIDRLQQQNAKLEKQLLTLETATDEENLEFLNAHQKFLVGIINEMRNFSHAQNATVDLPNSSTPNNSSTLPKVIIPSSFDSAVLGSNLSHSIHGDDVNRAYLEANRSDYSFRDMSCWFYKPKCLLMPPPPLRPLAEVCHEEAVTVQDTEMHNFKALLVRVKEIMEDSYSDNYELAAAAQNLENIVDDIIKREESRRNSLSSNQD